MLRNTTATTDAATALRRELGYLSEEEVCELLGVTLGRFRVRQSTGSAPPHYKLGKRKVYQRVEVEAWIKRRRIARTSAQAA